MTPRISHDYHPNINIRIPRKSSKLFGGDFAAAMARVTSFNRWAIIEHDRAPVLRCYVRRMTCHAGRKATGLGGDPVFSRTMGRTTQQK
jgi:hypothetical protein